MCLNSPHFTSEPPQHHHKNTTRTTTTSPQKHHAKNSRFLKTPIKKARKSAEIPRHRQSNFFPKT
jgi:hypothetical protein